jgi:hypothetical protein
MAVSDMDGAEEGGVSETGVWVVEQGSYSDYHVVGVFSSEKNARQIVALLKESDCYDEPTVAFWEMNPGIRDINAGHKLWNVRMLRDGFVESAEGREVSSYNFGGNVWVWERSKAPAYQGTDTPDALDATVWAKSAKHAVKIANEHRARLIASGEWK